MYNVAMGRPRHRQSERVVVVSNPKLTREAVREFGDTWERLAWHGLVWSYLLIEIPTQLVAFGESAREPAVRRLEQLQEYWPNDEETVAFARQVYAWKRPTATICGDGRIARVSLDKGQWPNEQTVSVDFALNGGGEISIRCINTPSDRPKLPTVLQGPYPDRTASQEAARLARAAISLVADAPPVVAPPSPYSAA